MMKGQKGITLVALIITIIVMLILVGVSISVALNGDLFGKAKGATKDTRTAQINEAIALAKADIFADYYDGTKTEQLTGSDVEGKINKYLDGSGLSVTVADGTTTAEGTTYTPVLSESVTKEVGTLNTIVCDFWKTTTSNP